LAESDTTLDGPLGHTGEERLEGGRTRGEKPDVIGEQEEVRQVDVQREAGGEVGGGWEEVGVGCDVVSQGHR
jgi:hypothetical protein